LTKKLIIFILIILFFLSINAKELGLFYADNRSDFKIIKKNRAIQTVNYKTKGEKLFAEKIQKYCGMSGGKFALTYSQDEWEEIAEAGKFNDIILKILPPNKKHIPDTMDTYSISIHLYVRKR